MGEARRRAIAGDPPRGPKREKPSKASRKQIEQDLTDFFTFAWRPGMFPILAEMARLNKKRLEGSKDSDSTEPAQAEGGHPNDPT